jgi:sugar lactone lactonase YvrE
MNCKPGDGGRFIFDNQWGDEGTDFGQFNTPKGIFVFPDVEIGRRKGRVILTDTFNHRIQIFELDGAFVDSWGSYGQGQGEFDTPSGVAVNIEIGGILERGKRGRVIITDTFNHRVQIFDFAGGLVLVFGEEGSGNGQMNQPTSVGANPITINDNLDRRKGRVILTDTFNHRVQIFDMFGNFISTFGSEGTEEGQFDTPTGLYFTDIGASASTKGKRGRVILTDTFNHRVQIFDEDGNFIEAIGSEGTGDGEFSEPRAVTLDIMGNIYVADTNNHRVQIFDEDGNFVEAIGEQGSGEAQFESPEGLAIGPNGNLYVSDTGNNRVQVFDLTIPIVTEFQIETKTDITAGTPEKVSITALDEDGKQIAFDGTVEIASFNPDIQIDTPSINLIDGVGEANVIFNGSGSTELAAIYGYLFSISDTFNVNQTTLYVSQTTGNDSNPGTQAEPLQNIHTAINQMETNGLYGEIIVAGGNYSYSSETSSRIVVKNGISLYGGYNPVDWTRDIATFQTIIQDTSTTGGTLTVPNAPIYIDSGVSNITTIDGFYINGSSTDGTHSAGILIDNGAATISNNVIIGGTGQRSYSIYVNGTDESLKIMNNHLNGGSGTSAYGVDLNNTNLHLYNNTIVGCSLGTGTNTENSFGIHIEGASPYIRNNTIDGGNPSGGAGFNNSTILVLNNTTPIIENNIMLTSGGNSRLGISDPSGTSIPISIKNNDIYDVAGTLSTVYSDGTTNYVTVTDLNTLPFAENNLPDDALLDIANLYIFTATSPISVTTGGIHGSAMGWIFNTDKTGTLRTGDGITGWSIGAYEKD